MSLVIKKTKSKPFHLGNRLNGNGGNVHATYGVFENGVQVGYACRTGCGWDAYTKSGKRMNSYTARTLSKLGDILKTLNES